MESPSLSRSVPGICSIRAAGSVRRQASERRKAPQPNYSLSIALQENALRVMCLTRERLETLLLSRGCSGGGLGSSPGERHQGCHAAGAKALRSLALSFAEACGMYDQLRKALESTIMAARTKFRGQIASTNAERTRN